MGDLSSARRPPPVVTGPMVRMLPPACRLSLRGGADVVSAAGAALDLPMSTTACRSARRDARAALWLGPDEQLLLAPIAEAAEIQRDLSAALAGKRHSLVDISHRQVAFEVSGSQAHTALSVGCPLDLDPAAFPVGMCTRTVLGKADVVMWRVSAESFHIEVWRSFADYVVRFLGEAVRELAC